MFVERIKLLDFRNYDSLEMEFGPGMNILYGNNGNGKTNILESMYLCAAGRSHRTAKDAELIRLGAKCYYAKVMYAPERAEGARAGADTGAKAVVEEGADAETIETAYEAGGRKQVKLNGITVDRIGNSIGKLKAVMFSPEDVAIVKEGPAERRRLADMAISQQKPLYFFDLQQYNRIALQKNAVLKGYAVKRDARDMLDVWNESMVKTGARIICERKKYIEAINRYFTVIYAEIASGADAESAEITYAPSVNLGDADGKEDEVAEMFKDALERAREREIEARCSLIGPQRDDIRFMMNGGSLKLYGSQGQQRSAMLALKLSEIEMSREMTGETPILLLDDVMSELDRHRRKYLYRRVAGIQTFITCTDRGVIEKGGDKRYYYVEKGNVEDRTGKAGRRKKRVADSSGGS